MKKHFELEEAEFRNNWNFDFMLGRLAIGLRDDIIKKFNQPKRITMKKKPIVKYAVCFALNKKCLSGDIQLFQTRAKAKEYVYQLHCEAGGFEDDHHIVKVLLTN